ncbi:hypothetical protein NMG60_11022695 [Bertholletia excelsa]
MAGVKGPQWREKMEDGTWRELVPDTEFVGRVYRGLQGIVMGFLARIWRFLVKAWNLGVSEPKKVIHCIKVGVALSLVSLFYYMRPLYDGVGGNAMWAVMTVVVVFEYTVGATLYKCINRTIATFLAGSLGMGTHWIAIHSGEKIEPVVVGFSVFLLASAVTFSRFIPTIKARFDYGAMIFILTFSLVSVSGYRVDELFAVAHTRLSTIIIGTSICILVSMIFCPVWAGTELHLLINRNMEKLAESLDGCIAEYFKESDGSVKAGDKDLNTTLQGYKCALNSKAAEETMANHARWEPAHGPFNFRHPWKQYLKIGAAIRSCAFYIESLSSCNSSEIQVPDFPKDNFSDVCLRLSSHCSKVLKELAVMMKTMTKSPITDLLVGEMNYTVQELQNALKSLPNEILLPPALTDDSKGEPTTKSIITMIEILPLATTISLLIRTAARIEAIVDAVDELADLAEFKPATDRKSQQSQSATSKRDDETMKILQKV